MRVVASGFVCVKKKRKKNLAQMTWYRIENVQQRQMVRNKWEEKPKTENVVTRHMPKTKCKYTSTTCNPIAFALVFECRCCRDLTSFLSPLFFFQFVRVFYCIGSKLEFSCCNRIDWLGLPWKQTFATKRMNAHQQITAKKEAKELFV